MVFLFTAHCDEDGSIILEAHPSIIDSALANLKKYGVFFKTEITDISETAIRTTRLIYPISSDCGQEKLK